METTPWVFDEEPHRAVLPEMRMWMEDELHHNSIARFAAGSKRERRLVLLVHVYQLYHTLFYQVVNGQLIDTVARRANRKLVAENEQLVLNNKQLTIENKRLVVDAKFFHKEAVYYKLAFNKADSIAKAFFSWAPDYIIKMKGGTPS